MLGQTTIGQFVSGIEQHLGLSILVLTIWGPMLLEETGHGIARGELKVFG